MRKSRLVLSLILIVSLLLSASPALAEGGKNRITKVKAEIVSIDEATGIWQIGDLQILVNERTNVVEDAGPAEVGAIVQLVFNKSGDEPYQAILIRVMSPAGEPAVITLRGLVTEYVDDTIVVNGMTIQILPETTVIGVLRVGALVKAEVKVGDGTYEGVRIQVLRVDQVERDVTFQGLVEDIVGDVWTIRGREVLVTPETILVGEPGLGDLVTVHALLLEDGSLVAVKIVKRDATPEPQQTTFEGIIQRFPTDNMGLWLIGGRKVFVDEATIINGEAQLGVNALVLAQWRGNGRLDAIEITIENVEPSGTISGPIVKLPGGTLGRWEVGIWKINVVPNTVIEGTPAIGAWAEVEVQRQGRSGTLMAIRIVITDGDVETPEPTIPAETPEPTIPAEPTIPPSVDVTPDPEPDPSPEPSPEPSRERTKKPKPHAVETPQPEDITPVDYSSLRRSNT